MNSRLMIIAVGILMLAGVALAADSYAPVSSTGAYTVPGTGPAPYPADAGTGWNNQAMATWDGYVYILRGDYLTKYSRKLTEIKSITVAVPPTPPFRDGMVSGNRRGNVAEKMPRRPATQGGRGMAEKYPGTVVPGMRPMQGGNAQLSADGKGVYLLRAGRLAVFNHDLKIIAATEIDAPESGIMMPLDTSQVKSIKDGKLAVTTVWVHAREANVQVRVMDKAGAQWRNASVVGFLYSKGRPERGVELKVYSRGGEFIIPCTFAAPGEYELALRIKRPGMADVLEYKSLSVR